MEHYRMNEPSASRSPRCHRPGRTRWRNIFPPVFTLAAWLLFLYPAAALERTNVVFKIFQFPPNLIPTIDGQTNDWDIVPEAMSSAWTNWWMTPANIPRRTRKRWTCA